MVFLSEASLEEALLAQFVALGYARASDELIGPDGKHAERESHDEVFLSHLAQPRTADEEQEWMGVTTVGDVRAAGGDTIATPGYGNHATVTGLTGQQASPLLQVVKNPNPSTN